MTICIAAACNEGKAIVAMADKMITYTAPPFHQFEHPRPKVYSIAKNAVILTAGSALLPSDFINKIENLKRKYLKGEESIEIPLRTLADIISEAFRELRRDLIVQRYLMKYDLEWKDYINFIRGGLGGARESGSSLPSSGIFGIASPMVKIFADIEDFKLELEVILAGVDEEGAHIYVIEDPGIKNNFNDIGYAAIGTGYYHAIRSFIENNYSIDIPLWKALYIVFEAKKYAESAPGVGSETDAAVITRNGIVRLKKEHIEELERIYQNKVSKIGDLLKGFYNEIEELLKKWEKELANQNTGQ